MSHSKLRDPDMRVICDDREFAVNAALRKCALADPKSLAHAASTLRMTTGDFAITSDGKCVAIIERKTWADLMASFKDDRVTNIEKLLALRESEECKIIYLIEGRPKPAKGLNLKACRAHLDRLMFRDDVHIMYSESVAGSAELLVRLMCNIGRLQATQQREARRVQLALAEAEALERSGSLQGVRGAMSKKARADQVSEQAVAAGNEEVKGRLGVVSEAGSEAGSSEAGSAAVQDGSEVAGAGQGSEVAVQQDGEETAVQGHISLPPRAGKKAPRLTSTTPGAETLTKLTKVRRPIATVEDYLAAITGIGKNGAIALTAASLTLASAADWEKTEASLPAADAQSTCLKRSIAVLAKFHARLLERSGGAEEVGIIATVPGVSVKTAKSILSKVTLYDILTCPAADVIALVHTAPRGKTFVSANLARKVVQTLRQ